MLVVMVAALILRMCLGACISVDEKLLFVVVDVVLVSWTCLSRLI